MRTYEIKSSQNFWDAPIYGVYWFFSMINDFPKIGWINEGHTAKVIPTLHKQNDLW